jgi:hypothetical protein
MATSRSRGSTTKPVPKVVRKARTLNKPPKAATRVTKRARAKKGRGKAAAPKEEAGDTDANAADPLVEKQDDGEQQGGAREKVAAISRKELLAKAFEKVRARLESAEQVTPALIGAMEKLFKMDREIVHENEMPHEIRVLWDETNDGDPLDMIGSPLNDDFTTADPDSKSSQDP